MDRGAWWAAVHGVAKSDTAEPLSAHTRVALRLADSQRLTHFDNHLEDIEADVALRKIHATWGDSM